MVEALLLLLPPDKAAKDQVLLQCVSPRVCVPPQPLVRQTSQGVAKRQIKCHKINKSIVHLISIKKATFCILRHFIGILAPPPIHPTNHGTTLILST